MLTGLYLPGDSPVHRAGPMVKLAALMILTSALLLVARPLVVLAGGVFVILGYAAARLGPSVLLGQVAPMRWILLLLVPLQIWTSGLESALVFSGTLVVSVAAASLVTLTTPLSRMLDALVRAAAPLRIVGADPERLGLLLALAIRAIPVVATLFEEAREARSARGLDRSLRALAAPVVIRTVRHATNVGEALAARGLDD